MLISACGEYDPFHFEPSRGVWLIAFAIFQSASRKSRIAATLANWSKSARLRSIDQLDKLTSRARLLQRCMVTFYLSLGAFVATSVAIGVVAISSSLRYTLAPVVCGLIGALFLFYGSILLIFEARLALSTVHAEMRISSGAFPRRWPLPRSLRVISRILYTFADEIGVQES